MRTRPRSWRAIRHGAARPPIVPATTRRRPGAGAGARQRCAYNLGNALAREGKYKEAIEAYDRALEARSRQCRRQGQPQGGRGLAAPAAEEAGRRPTNASTKATMAARASKRRASSKAKSPMARIRSRAMTAASRPASRLTASRRKSRTPRARTQPGQAGTDKSRRRRRSSRPPRRRRPSARKGAAAADGQGAWRQQKKPAKGKDAARISWAACRPTIRSRDCRPICGRRCSACRMIRARCCGGSSNWNTCSATAGAPSEDEQP